MQRYVTVFSDFSQLWETIFKKKLHLRLTVFWIRLCWRATFVNTTNNSFQSKESKKKTWKQKSGISYLKKLFHEDLNDGGEWNRLNRNDCCHGISRLAYLFCRLTNDQVAFSIKRCTKRNGEIICGKDEVVNSKTNWIGMGY